MKYLTPLIALALSGLASAGCSKHSPATTSTRQTNSVTNVTQASEPLDTNHFRLVRTIVITNPETATLPPSNDLGIIEVSDRKPTSHTLADGRVCTVTPTILVDGKVSLKTDVITTNASGVKTSSLVFEAPADGQ